MIGSEIWTSRSLNKPSGFVGLTWKAEDYIRICKWNGNRTSGIGIKPVASVENGWFNGQAGNLENIRRSDQLG